MPAHSRIKPPAGPARSLERTRLAAAIEAHAAAVAQAERVTAAQQRAEDAYFELYPAVAAAREALARAREYEPLRLVDVALGDAEDIPGAAEAEAALEEAEQRLAEARSVRSAIRDEAGRADQAVEQTKFEIDRAVAAAVAADPARAALLAEFRRVGARALHCAQALRTAGLIVQGAEAHGLAFRIHEAPTSIDKTAFRPDPGWLNAIAALREDADSVLPGLPGAEDDPGEAAAVT